MKVHFNENFLCDDKGIGFIKLKQLLELFFNYLNYIAINGIFIYSALLKLQKKLYNTFWEY